MENYSQFGLKAREIMLQNGISMRSLANQLGVTSAYIGEILKGTRPGKKQKAEIAKILGIKEASL